jgi:hypothetical protein
MRFRLLIGLLIVIATAVFGAKQRDWKTGKVVDSANSKAEYATSATTQTTTNGTVSPDIGAGSTVKATSTSSTRIYHTTVDSNTIFIVGDEYLYTTEDSAAHGGAPAIQIAHAIGNRKHGCRFIVGDDVKYSQEKSKLYAIDADGKECQLTITRQERRIR